MAFTTDIYCLQASTREYYLCYGIPQEVPYCDYYVLHSPYSTERSGVKTRMIETQKWTDIGNKVAIVSGNRSSSIWHKATTQSSAHLFIWSLRNKFECNVNQSTDFFLLEAMFHNDVLAMLCHLFSTAVSVKTLLMASSDAFHWLKTSEFLIKWD